MFGRRFAVQSNIRFFFALHQATKSGKPFINKRPALASTLL
jgi:hypothetical protein